MAIEFESPEEFGYDRIRHNLAESSTADTPLRDLDVALDDLVLMYGDHRGAPGLRSAIAAATTVGTGAAEASLTPDDILVTPGAAAALFIVSTSLLGPDDEVIVVRPNYATNLETPRAIGATVRFVDLRFEDGWAVDPERVRTLLSPRTALVSITNPHNPTGAVVPGSVVRDLIGLVEGHPRARLLVDETYREMTFGGALPLAASLSDRAIGVSSLSKADGLPGIRVGWLTTRDRLLLERFLAAKEQIVITGSVVDEAIAEIAMVRRPERLPAILAGIEGALATVREWIAASEAFEWVEPRGGVVGFPRFRSAFPIDADRFYEVLLDRYGTIVGPGHWFDQPRTSFRLGYGWPSPESLATGLAGLTAAALDARVRAR
jgi:aspartate/methionine/tyrosine aminotransferase